MKKYFYLLLFLIVLISNLLIAQTGARFGFRGGYSMATQYGIIPKDNPYSVDSFYRHGLGGGLLIYYPITDSFGIQQEFLYATKGSIQDIKLLDQPVTTHVEYDINYFELPLIFRYNFIKIGDFNFFGTTGFAMSILLKGEYRIDGKVKIGNDKLTFDEKGKIEGIDTFDYSFIYGSGVDFPLFDKDCFFEYRFTIGWNTILMPTYEGEEPAPLRNQDYLFTLGLYF